MNFFSVELFIILYLASKSFAALKFKLKTCYCQNIFTVRFDTHDNMNAPLMGIVISDALIYVCFSVMNVQVTLSDGLVHPESDEVTLTYCVFWSDHAILSDAHARVLIDGLLSIGSQHLLTNANLEMQIPLYDPDDV